MKKQRIVNIFYYLLIAAFILSGIALGIYSFLSEDKKGPLFLGFATLLFFLFPYLLKKKGVVLPHFFWILTLMYLILGYNLGFIFDGYERWLHFDKFVHFISGFVNCLIGLMIFIYLNRRGKAVWSSAIWFSLFFSMFVALIFEFAECIVFLVTGYDTQRTLTTGVFDTMGDLTAALISSISVSFYYYYRGKKMRLNKTIIGKFLELNEIHNPADQ